MSDALAEDLEAAMVGRPPTRAALAVVLGLPESAPTVALWAALRDVLDVAERPGGIDPGELRDAVVKGCPFRLPFVRRAKVIGWEGEQQRQAHEATVALGLDLAASLGAEPSPETVARLNAQLSSPEWAERYTKMAAIHARRHELHRQVVRYGVRSYDIPDCPPAKTEKDGRDEVLTEESIDHLETRDFIEAAALAVLRHWTLTKAEKKS